MGKKFGGNKSSYEVREEERQKLKWFVRPNWYLAAYWGDTNMLSFYAEQTEEFGGCEMVSAYGDFGYCLVRIGGETSQPENIRKTLAQFGVFLKLDKGPIQMRDFVGGLI